jgi:hypothetical protein
MNKTKKTEGTQPSKVVLGLQSVDFTLLGSDLGMIPSMAFAFSTLKPSP